MLSDLLLEALVNGGSSPALEIGDRVWSYRELLGRAAALVASWDRIDPSRRPVAILCDHSFLGYAAVVGALVSGRAYVPLKPGLPAERVATILELAVCRVAVGDQQLIASCADAFERAGTVIAGEDGDFDPPRLAASGEPDPVAYVMFTSGSTGVPKGVVLRASNLEAYCTAARSLFPFQRDDRCTQLFDLSFDLSVHDILMTFLSGARLVTDAARQRIDPVGFAAAARVTVWFSVPSVLSMAKRFRRLRPGVLPEVRLALFCGEALPRSLAQDWLAAAPNAANFNVYGPTEATIAITWHRFDAASLEGLTEASVPIGVPYPGSDCAVIGKDGAPLEAGQVGELWLGGPQLADGYLGLAEQTDAKFVEVSLSGHAGCRWYRTGDLAQSGSPWGLLFKGRIDQQVKIGGYRVELDEIESVVRSSRLAGEVAAFDFESHPGVAAIGCAITGPSGSETDLLAYCRKHLPNYMVPARLIVLDTIPLNQNGKVDRGVLRTLALRQGG